MPRGTPALLSLFLLGACAEAGSATAPLSIAPPGPLVGQESEMVTRQLGQPAARHREDDVEFWQYRRPGCVVDLFLARDRGRLSVVRAVGRRIDRQQIAPEQCLSTGSI